MYSFVFSLISKYLPSVCSVLDTISAAGVRNEKQGHAPEASTEPMYTEHMVRARWCTVTMQR